MAHDVGQGLQLIATALSAEERAAAAVRARARAAERAAKREKFMQVPAAPLPEGWRWHVVQSEARRELTAAEDIDKLGFIPWVPSFEKEIVDRRSASRSRRTEIVRRVVFPRYLFVGFAQSAAWSDIAHARGVTGMVMAATRPEPVPDPQIAEALFHASYNFGQPLGRESKFKPGDDVRAVDGPFSGLQGNVVDVDSSLRITVLMALFGRKVRVMTSEEVLELV